MAQSGSENRQRIIKRTVRFSTIEDALLCTNADLAGMTIASYLRTAALKSPPPRTARRTMADHQALVQLLAEVGRLRTAFDAALEADGEFDAETVETAIRDQSELRIILFEALGITP